MFMVRAFIVLFTMQLLSALPCWADAIDEAAARGDLAVVEQIVLADPRIVNKRVAAGAGAAWEAGSTPLHEAARNGHLEVVKFLLARGAGVNAVRDDGESSLHEAAFQGHLDVARLLIDSAAKLNGKGAHGYTPLQWSVDQGHPDVSRLLLARGADPEVRDNMGNTPLQHAFRLGKAEVAKLLLEYGAEIGVKRDDTPSGDSAVEQPALLVRAVRRFLGTWDVKYNNAALSVLAFSSDGRIGDSPYWGSGVLRPTAEGIVCDWSHGQKEIYRLTSDNTMAVEHWFQGVRYTGVGTLRAGTDAVADLAGDGAPRTCIQYAALSGSDDCVKLALAYGGDPAAKDGGTRSALEIARTLGKVSADLILRSAMSSAAQGWTAAHFAALYGITDAFTYLRQHGKPLDDKTNDGQTPLMIACVNNKPEAATKLLSLHCKVNTVDSKNETALHKVVRRNDELLARILVSAECDTTIRNSAGETAGDIALKMGNPDLERALETSSVSGASPTLLRKFLSNRDSISIQEIVRKDKSLVTHRYAKDWTPLHFAAFQGDQPSATALLEAGAEIDAANSNGTTPLMIAVQEGHVDIVKLLLDRRASVTARDKQGWTPLHIAAQEDRLEIAQALLRAGARKTTKDSKGRTPADVAQKTGHERLAQILK
jgi:ankyrin